MEKQLESFQQQDINQLLFIKREPEAFQRLPFQDQEGKSNHCLPLLKSRDQDFLDLSPFSTSPPIDFMSSLDGFMNLDEEVSDRVKKVVPKKRKLKKRRKNMIDDNSPFHNCQKHLIRALKNIIIFPEEQQEEKKEVQKLAKDIWKVFEASSIKTKKLLHSVIMDNSEDELNDSELKTYGLLELYINHGSQSFSAAKNYLSKLAIDQLDNFNVNCYVDRSKIKDKKNFKEYVQCFRKELSKDTITKKVVQENN